MTVDVEMAEASTVVASKVQNPQKDEEESTPLTLVEEIELALGSLQKAAANFDNRYVSKVHRDLGGIRRKVAKDPASLAQVIAKLLPVEFSSRKTSWTSCPCHWIKPNPQQHLQMCFQR